MVWPRPLAGKESLIVVAGPTASGKSALAIKLAAAFDGEIISCDSVQVYRGFNIGSAKPSIDEQAQIVHHLINCCESTEQYHAARFRADAFRCIDDIFSRGKLPIIAGGTTLYLSALLSGLSTYPESDPQLRERFTALGRDERYSLLMERNPERAKKLHPNDTVRVVRALELSEQLLPNNDFLEAKELELPPTLIINLTVPNDLLRHRVADRTNQMVKTGLINETLALLGSEPRDAAPFSSVGYKEALEFIAGTISEVELKESIAAATARLAKRQRTFWRNEPLKRGWSQRPTQDEPQGLYHFEDRSMSSRSKGVQKGFSALHRSTEELIREIGEWKAAKSNVEVWHVAWKETLEASPTNIKNHPCFGQ